MVKCIECSHGNQVAQVQIPSTLHYYFAEDFQITKVHMKDRNCRSIMKKIKDRGLEDGSTRTKTKVELGI